MACPAGVDLEGALFVPFDPDGGLPRTAAGEDGTYRMEALPEGPATLYVRMNASDSPWHFRRAFRGPSALLELGQAQVRGGGETRADFDLADRFPGGITVDVRLNGESFPGGIVEAVLQAEDRDELETGGRLDGQGHLRLFPLFVGDWELQVQRDGSRWTYEHPEVLRVEPGRDVFVAVDVTVVVGRVRILDAASGEPLPGWRVRVGAGEPYTTDAEGWLELELTPGTYALRDAGPGARWNRDTGEAWLDWGPWGPAREELLLPVAR